MSHKFTIVLHLILGWGVSSFVCAEEGQGYNFVQFRYLEPNINQEFLRSAAREAFGLQGAYVLRRDLQLFARYLDADLQSQMAFPGLALESGEDSRLSLGMGYSYLLSPHLDVVARAAYEKLNLQDSRLAQDKPSLLRNYDEEGFSLQLGLRGLVSSQGTWGARITRLEVDRFETGYGFGGHVTFENGISFGADVQMFDDVTTWTLGGRYYFGD